MELCSLIFINPLSFLEVALFRIYNSFSLNVAASIYCLQHIPVTEYLFSLASPKVHEGGKLELIAMTILFENQKLLKKKKHISN